MFQLQFNQSKICKLDNSLDSNKKGHERLTIIMGGLPFLSNHQLYLHLSNYFTIKNKMSRKHINVKNRNSEQSWDLDKNKIEPS